MCTILRGIVLLGLGNSVLAEVEITREIEQMSWSKLFFSPVIQSVAHPSLSTLTRFNYHGIISTDGKKPTYWINDEMKQTLPKELSLQKQHLLLRKGKKRIRLSVGESYDLADDPVYPALSKENE